MRISPLCASLFTALLLPLSPLAKAQTWTFVHDENFPPFAQFENGKSSGMAIDILNEALQRTDTEAEFVAVPFPQIQPSLESGKADAIFPLAINAERQKTLDFSQPLLMTGGALFVRAPEATPADLAALAGKVIVTPKTGPLAGYIAKNAPEANLVVTADYDESLEKLMNGSADAAALNFQVGTILANRSYPGQITLPESLFLELPLAVAVPKGENDELLAQINEGLSLAATDGSIDKISARWLQAK